MKTAIRLLLATLLLLGTMSTIALADGNNPPACPPTGCPVQVPTIPN